MEEEEAEEEKKGATFTVSGATRGTFRAAKCITSEESNGYCSKQ